MNASRDPRDRLGLTVRQWAKALAVSTATVTRWEDGSTVPAGLHAEVMRGISAALEEGADPVRMGKLISLGIGSVIFNGLVGASAGSAPRTALP